MSGPLLVILQAPQGCGKTTAAALIAQAFGCDSIHDDELNPRAVEADLYRGRRVLLCTPNDFHPTDEAAPVLRITIEGDHPTRSLHDLLIALGQPIDALSVINTCNRSE